MCFVMSSTSFFFNDTATTEIYTLSLHDALPISASTTPGLCEPVGVVFVSRIVWVFPSGFPRSEEHTSELQSHSDLVCRLLLEKKKNMTIYDGTNSSLIGNVGLRVQQCNKRHRTL